MLLLQPAGRILARRTARNGGGHQIFKKRLRLQFRGILQHRERLRPDRLQRILTRLPSVRHPPLFQDVVLTQILARRLAVHPCFHCTHTDGSSLVALDHELGELGSCDHNPEQQQPPRPASNSMPPHPEKPPLQWVILIVVRG